MKRWRVFGLAGLGALAVCLMVPAHVVCLGVGARPGRAPVWREGSKTTACAVLRGYWAGALGRDR